MKKTKKKLEKEISDMNAKLSEIEENINSILRSAATEIKDEEITKLKEDLVYYREQLNIKVKSFYVQSSKFLVLQKSNIM